MYSKQIIFEGTGCGEYDDACPDTTLLIRGGSDACIQNAPWHAILARKDNLEGNLFITQVMIRALYHRHQTIMYSIVFVCF